MTPLTFLDAIALTLIAAHFGVPLAYYLYAKKKWLPSPWNLNPNSSYQPRVTVIIPTYNEAELIEKKLDDIHRQDYPRNKLEVIVVDSASTDGTSHKVREWIKRHPDLNLKIVEETERRGKAVALNTALKHTTGEIVIVTDVDAWWPSRNTIRRVVKWFADPVVGAVSCLKKPAEADVANIEEGYRQYYNVIRLAESKAWATPVFHGELAAFRKELLNKLGGFPTDIGADDSYTATRIALTGHRAIIPKDLQCVELVPTKGYHSWRIRRAQHLVQHFIKTLTIKPKTPKPFKPILYTEVFLHLANPWLLLVATTLFATLSATGSPIAITLLATGIALLAYKPYRTWVATQLYLIVATMRNLWRGEIVWEKQEKH